MNRYNKYTYTSAEFATMLEERGESEHFSACFPFNYVYTKAKTFILYRSNYCLTSEEFKEACYIFITNYQRNNQGEDEPGESRDLVFMYLHETCRLKSQGAIY